MVYDYMFTVIVNLEVSNDDQASFPKGRTYHSNKNGSITGSCGTQSDM